MEKSKRFEDKLKEFYESTDMKSKDLYESIIAEKRAESNESPWYLYLLTYGLYRFYQHSSLSELLHSKKIPVELPKGLKYGEFKKELSLYKLYPTGFNVDGKNDTYYDMLLRAVTLDHNQTGLDNGWDWFYVKRKYMDKIEKTDDDFAYKLYIPIANKDLVQFALMLMLKGYNNDFEFYFKFNNNWSFTRSDNIVIYATRNNINDYINAIDQIMAENPNLIINSDMINPFGINYNGCVSIAPYLDNGEHSFSSIICSAIEELKESSSSYEEFISNVDRKLNDIEITTNKLFERDNVDLTAHKVTASKKSYKSDNKKTRQ